MKQKNNIFTVLDKPKPYKMIDYYEVLDRATNIFKNIPNLISIYQTGTISDPGISDLDILLVLDDSPRGLKYADYYRLFDKRDRYILMHSPSIINKTFFKIMRNFYIPGDLQLQYGEELQIKEIQHQGIIEKIIVTEFILSIFNTIIRAIDTRVLKIRNLLCTLNSLRHDVNVCNMNKNEYPDVWEYIETVSELRSNWYGLPDDVQMLKLNKIILSTPTVLCNILDYLSDELINLQISSAGIHRVQLGPNSYLMSHSNGESTYAVRKRYFIKMLLKNIPFSKHLYDAQWFFSDYIIKVFPILLSYFTIFTAACIDISLQSRYDSINRYIYFGKKYKDFSLLLPTIRIPFQINNIKWLVFNILRNILQAPFPRNYHKSC